MSHRQADAKPGYASESMSRRLLEGKVALVTGGSGEFLQHGAKCWSSHQKIAVVVVVGIPFQWTLTGFSLVVYISSSGTIGKAIGKALLSEGASVVLTARRIAQLQQAKEELVATVSPASTNRVHVIVSDIAEEENVIKLFSEIDRQCGRIDLLVNNAGINVAKATSDLSVEEFQRVLNVNVVGAFACSREAMKRMTTDRGRIINIGSISATSPRPNSAAYTTSKFAIQGLTQSLALDGRDKGIAVGIIHPGNVVSDLLSPEDVEIRGKTEGFLQADDVAKCVLTMATLPYSANVLEMTVLPTTQPFVGRG
jgi:NADP-dependent 3-hydroxy acid dehydrogenase YdfG